MKFWERQISKKVQIIVKQKRANDKKAEWFEPFLSALPFISIRKQSP